MEFPSSRRYQTLGVVGGPLTATQGRFLSPDEFTGGPVDAFSANDPLPPGPLPYAVISNPQSLNKYAYTLNNPLRYVDPDGHGIDFWIGVAQAVVSNFALGAGREAAYSTDNATGQAVGDAISVAVGVVEVAVGGAAVLGGSGEALVTAPAAGTGVGAVVPAAGVATAVAGAAIATHGAGMAASGAIHLVKSVSDTDTGTIYRVPGSGTESGKPYVGRHNKPDPAKTRRSNDGRDRTKAKVLDKYDAKKTQQGRRKEQRQIDKHGLKNLDNKRNEIRKKKDVEQ